MATTVGNIIEDRVRVLLRDIDDGGISHKDEELISWINEGQAEIARIRPEASSATMNVALIAGVHQTIPDGSTLLLEVVANVDMPGGELNRIVRSVDRDTLDKEDVNWPLAPSADLIKRFVVSATDPRSFYVYPPHTGNSAKGIKIVVGQAPDEVTAMTDVIGLPSIYSAPLANYVLYRAFLKQLESPEAQQRSIEMLNIFNEQMGITDRNQEQRSAKNRQPAPASR